MSIASVLPWIQIALSVLLAGLILLQQSDASMGAAFGGSNSGDTVERTRRGADRVIFQTTIVIAILFALSAIASALI